MALQCLAHIAEGQEVTSDLLYYVNMYARIISPSFLKCINDHN